MKRRIAERQGKEGKNSRSTSRKSLVGKEKDQKIHTDYRQEKKKAFTAEEKRQIEDWGGGKNEPLP